MIRTLRILYRLWQESIPKEKRPRRLYILSMFILWVNVPVCTLFMHLGDGYQSVAGLLLICMVIAVYFENISLHQELEQSEKASQVAERLRGDN